MFAERLGKLLGDLFGAKPKYITVPVSTAAPAQALPPDRLPRHVAIIMDGNGRWANARNLPRTAGHAAGTEALRDIIRASDDWGIECLTIYAFSTENWARSKDEVGALMSLLLRYFASEIDELDEKNVRILILGDVDGLPAPQREAVVNAMARTRGNTGLKLNIALNYGGRAELVRAGADAGAARAGGRTRARRHRRGGVCRRAVHRWDAGRRPADSHQRRDAAVELPAMADGVRRDGV